MHTGAITFHDNDHVTTAWTMYADQKAGEQAKFDIRRKK